MSPQETMHPLVGHSAQREMLARLVRANRLPSTMLFAGVAGIGKKLVAEELVRTLFCLTPEAPYGGCGECKHCRQAGSGNLPDALSVNCSDKEAFDIEQLRELMHTLGMRPFLGGVRTVLFNDAEQLSIQASNLLLKSLEEPRAGNHFILICANPGMLPPTLLSRCQIWFFDRLTEPEIKEVLTAQGKSENLPDLMKLADGSLAGISSLQEHINEWRDLSGDLRTIGGGNLTVAFQLAGELSKDKENLRERLSFLRIAGRSFLTASSDENSSFRWSSFLLDLLSAERLIFDRNLGATYVLNAVFAKLADSRSFTRSLRGATLLDQVVV